MYLGMPLFHGRVGKHTFEFVVDKVRKKLNGWDAKRLSMAGHITITKYVLLAILNYFIGTVHLPIFICGEIEKIARNFIWGSFMSNHNAALLS